MSTDFYGQDPMDRPLLRIGSVPYLNADPLTHGLEDDPEVTLSHSVPSLLMEQLRKGALDCAFAPTFDVLRNPDLRVVDGMCVSSDGPVASVVLLSRRPLDSLRTVGLDSSSMSSAHLVQVLLAELHGCRPEYSRVPPDAGAGLARHDAVLLIGDRALTECAEIAAGSASPTSSGPDDRVDVHDLGLMWQELTGLPFVYALFVTREDADEERIGEALLRSKGVGLASRDRLARRAAIHLDLPEEQLRAYLTENIRYHLGPRELSGIARYRELLGRHGLIAPRMVGCELRLASSAGAQ